VDIWRILLDIVVLLGAGALLGGLFERARQSAIVGYLVAGVLLGPNVLHVVRSRDEVLAVSELGVALLLFVIGLEFSWSRLRGMGRIALGSGTLQVVSTTILGAGVAAAAGLGATASLTIGAICALSSTACVVRVLTARGEIESVHGERALGILLVQDMAVVPLVLVVSVLAEGGTVQEVLWGVVRTAGIGVVLVVSLYVVFNHVVPQLLATGPMHSNRELPLLIAVVSGLGSGVVAHAVGVSPALGAFVAGMLLAGSPFAVQVRADVSSLKTLLLTLFFVSMGMLADPMWIASNALLVALVVGLVVIGKAAIVCVSLRVFEARRRSAIAAGVCLGQIGEFSFVLAGIARGRILHEDAFLLVVSTTVITMVLTPYLVSNARWFAVRLSRRVRTVAQDPGEAEEPVLVGIVIGFGPAGRAVSERIAEIGCRVVVVDENPAAARDARSLGYGVVTGDARYGEVLEHAGLQRASLVVVTVPETTTVLQIVRYVRLHASTAQVLVRARFHRYLPDIQAAGAHAVVDEEHEVGRLIARAYEELQRESKVVMTGEGEPPPGA
jgi:CPA2 family monovalent cation:H+ antiporter-2